MLTGYHYFTTVTCGKERSHTNIVEFSKSCSCFDPEH